MSACFTDIASGYSDAEAFERMLQGEGHYVSFGTGLQASTGLNPIPGYTGLSWNGATGFGGDPGYIDFSATGRIQYDAQLGDKWTIIFRDDADVTNIGAAYRSDGYYSLDGGATTGQWYRGNTPQTNAYVDVLDGVLTFFNDNAGTNAVDDLVILPYMATSAMMDIWTSADDAMPFFGPMPVMRTTGHFIAEQHSYMVGEVTGVSYVAKPQHISGNVSSTWVTNAKIVDFTLSEVSETYVRTDVL